MPLIMDSEKEMKWIEGERRRQSFYLILTVIAFFGMIYAFAIRILPENVSEPIYWTTFLFAFLAFLVAALMHIKSKRYLTIMDELLEERRYE